MSNYQKSKDEYLKTKVDTFVIRVPKGQKQIIQDYAKIQGLSLNAFVTKLIYSAVPNIDKPPKEL